MCLPLYRQLIEPTKRRRDWGRKREGKGKREGMMTSVDVEKLQVNHGSGHRWTLIL
jgi:hypothetical protein